MKRSRFVQNVNKKFIFWILHTRVDLEIWFCVEHKITHGNLILIHYQSPELWKINTLNRNNTDWLIFFLIWLMLTKCFLNNIQLYLFKAIIISISNENFSYKSSAFWEVFDIIKLIPLKMKSRIIFETKITFIRILIKNFNKYSNEWIIQINWISM